MDNASRKRKDPQLTSHGNHPNDKGKAQNRQRNSAQRKKDMVVSEPTNRKVRSRQVRGMNHKG
jgi:hypothetical protein